jgi:PAS domain-containing protein
MARSMADHDNRKQTPGPAWPVGGGEMGALIRAHAWSATPLGTLGTWPQSLRTLVDSVLACAFPMVVLWGPDLVQVYNDGYRALMGSRHPLGLGQPTQACWPEVWHINAPIYARVWAGETLTFEDKLYPITRHGYLEDAWFTLSYSPLRDEAGRIAGVLVTVFETTARVLAARQREQADAALREAQTTLEQRVVARTTEVAAALTQLRESEERFRTLVQTSSEVLYTMSPDWAEMRALSGGGFLADTSAPSRTWLAHYIHPDDQPRVLQAIEEAVRTKSVFELEHRVRRADGSLGWTLSRAVPRVGADGTIIEWFGAASDVTARRQAEDAVRQREAHFRAVADLVPDLLWRSDTSGVADWYNRRWLDYTGQTLAEAQGDGWLAVIHPDDRAGSLAGYRRGRRGE